VKRLITCGLLATLGLGLAAGPAHALRNLSLRQQGELPRDIYVDLVDPDHFHLDKMIVQFVEDTRIRLRDGRLVSLEGRSLGDIEAFLKAHPEISVERVFVSMSEDELEAYAANGERLSGWDVADLNNFYLFKVNGRNTDPRGLLEDLLKHELVQTVYYEPIPEPATCGSDPAPVTPSYVASQDYREAAPTGIDINYAWAHDPTYGNGVSSYWFQDLEWGWCETHEDFASSFLIRNPPDSGAANDYNHGTAVVSIVGACDDGKGVTGLVPDSRMTTRVVSNHPTTADALIAIGGDLLLGETYLIEMHAQGPSQGTVCVCNCGQFEYIAMEYWAANFNAILANSTNGRYCIEAAGNGSMDLDWAGYGGAFNLGVRDSQAIIVGAGTGDAVHNPECWTNHGSRISAQGWGSNVYASGYGDLFNQAGCDQDYTWSFSGTSSASPIVGGAAISLALIHYNQEGSYPSPTTLRSRLTINGTPQGPVDPWKEINVLPNMKGILAPDLAPYNPGWAAEVVPSDVSGTTVLPVNLQPAPAATYVDWAWVNWSRYSEANPFQNYILRDDVMVAFNNMVGGHPTFWYYTSEDVNLPTRGGLHYLRLATDWWNNVDESNEINNQIVFGYRWDPTVLASDAPTTFSRGPKRNPTGYSSVALDGYSNGGAWGWWDVAGVMPSSTADYDMYLFNSDPTPTTGWTGANSVSGYVNEVDFVGSNHNNSNTGNYFGVVNWADSAEDYTIEREGSTYLGAPPAVPTLAVSNQINAGEILDVFEMNVTSLTNIRFVLDITYGTADLAVFVFAPGVTYFARSGAAFTLNAAGAGSDEAGTFTPAATGWHGIVICKNLRTDLGNDAGYDLYWGPPAGDLTANLPAGWSYPVVARNGGAVGVLPATLNEGTTFADAGLINIGSGTMTAGSNLAFYLDGPFAYSSGDFVALASGATGTIANRSIGAVKGGRHELGAVLDYMGEVPEELPAGESNNGYFRQYAWAPYSLANLTPLSRTPAPGWANFNNPAWWTNPGWNQDGYQLTTTYWTGVGAMPTVSTEQLDLIAYNNADGGSESAFLNNVELDFAAPGAIGIMMANGNNLGYGASRNVGVLNNYAYPSVISTTNYTVCEAQRPFDLQAGLVTHGTLAGDATTGGHLLNVYDIWLNAGQSYPVQLFNNSGVNLGVAIFSADRDFAGLDDAAFVADAAGDAGDESGAFTPSVSGFHGVAVYRSDYTDLGPAAAYGIVIGNWGPAAVTDLDIHMVDIDGTDDIFSFYLDWSDVTQDSNGLPLTVDQYFCYYRTGASLPWNHFDTVAASQTGLWYASMSFSPDYYFMVTAVDVDGVVLAGSVPTVMPGDATTSAPLSATGTAPQPLWRVNGSDTESGR